MGSGLPDHWAGRSSENPANLAGSPLGNVPRSFPATMPQTDTVTLPLLPGE